MIKKNIGAFTRVKNFFGYGGGSEEPSRIGPSTLQQLISSSFDDVLSMFYYDQLHLHIDRFELYKTFDDMDADDLVVQCLDLFAEDAVQKDSASGRVLWAEAEDKEIEDLLNKKIQDLKLEENAFAIARELAKYGDSFSGIIQEEKEDGTPGEIVDLLAAPVYAVTRVDDGEGRLSGFHISAVENLTTKALGQGKTAPKQTPTDPPWSMVHFRMLGKNRMTSYGTSFLMASRRMYRKLRLIEDNLVLYRLKRAPDRFVFAIQGLNALSPEERARVIREIRQTLRKKTSINRETGTMRSELDPIGIDEDLIIDKDAVEVNRLTGSQQINAVMDIEYIRKRFLGTIGIPPDYLGFSDSPGSFAADIPLSFQDVNFSRKEKRLQAAFMEGVAIILKINLCWLGIDPKSKKATFTLHMNPVSAIDEKQRLEVEKIRVETLAALEDIGKALGITGTEWTEYLFKRSMLPTHLLRPDGKEVSGIIKGTIAVNESKILERFCKEGALDTDISGFLESIKGLSYDAKYFQTEGKVNLSKSRIEEISGLIEAKLDNDKKAFLMFFMSHGKHIFSSKTGANAFCSERLNLDDTNLPYSSEESGGQINTLIESWQGENKPEKDMKTRTLNLMEAVTVKLRKGNNKNDTKNID